jgi:hypothetical protein
VRETLVLVYLVVVLVLVHAIIMLACALDYLAFKSLNHAIEVAGI